MPFEPTPIELEKVHRLLEKHQDVRDYIERKSTLIDRLCSGCSYSQYLGYKHICTLSEYIENLHPEQFSQRVKSIIRWFYLE